MSDKPEAEDAASAVRRADGGPRTEPVAELPASAATPFKHVPMPRAGARRYGWGMPDVPLPLQLAIVVILGVLIATAIAAAYVKWDARATAAANARAAQEEVERMARERQQRLEAEQRAAAERAQAAVQEERQRLDAVREQQRLAEEARQAQLSDAQRMEQAFAASYRKPPGCADTASLQCVNHYIRAKRAFEARYTRELAQRHAASAP